MTGIYWRGQANGANALTASSCTTNCSATCSRSGTADNGPTKANAALTRSGLDWTTKYPVTAAGLAKLPVKTAYIDGELCGLRPDGVTSFEMMQQASDSALVYFAFDLLELDGADVAGMLLLERKERLATILKEPPEGIAFSEHDSGDGEACSRSCPQNRDQVLHQSDELRLRVTTQHQAATGNGSVAYSAIHYNREPCAERTGFPFDFEPWCRRQTRCE